MQFLSPALFWALLALAIPVLIHLFYFRRFRKVEFSNVRFLKEIKEETQRRSRIRNLLVLALRLLAFGAIIFAFIQPFLPAPGSSGEIPPRVAIIIDNSQSMAAQASEVSLLEKAKQRAREIVRTYPEQTEYQIISNDLDGSSNRLVGREDALATIDDIRLSAASTSGELLLGRVKQIPAADPDKLPVFLISDFQKSQFNLTQLSQDSSIDLAAVPVTAVVARNLSIDTAWLASPIQLVGEPTTILVKITNYGSEDADAVRLSVLTNGSSQPFGIRTVPAGSTTTDTLRLAGLRPGWTEAEINITDFPIEFDDRYYISFEVEERLKVLAVSDGELGPYLRSAFSPTGALSLETQRASNVNYSGLGEFDLIILDDLENISSGLAKALTEKIAAGGKALIFPNENLGTNAAGYNQLLNSTGLPALGRAQTGGFAVGRINSSSFVFGDVFVRLPSNLRLPQVKARYSIRGGASEDLLNFRDGDPFMIAKTFGRGILYLSASPLNPELNDLVRNGEIFIPMLYRMAFSGLEARPLAYTIGAGGVASFALSEQNGETALQLTSQNASFIPAQRRLGDVLTLSFGQAPERPGVFKLKTARDSSLASLAFNYSRQESPQEFLTSSDLEESGLPIYDGNEQGSLEAALQSGALGTAWWPYLIALALLALLAEALVLRFWTTRTAPNTLAAKARESQLSA